MQLKSLYIKDYKMLKDFRMEFNQPISLLIGKNGSGKSTVLEALAWILRGGYLHFVEEASDEPRIHEFELAYMIRLDETSMITSTTAHSHTDYINVKLKRFENAWKLEVDDSVLEKGEIILNYGYRKLLPTNILIYYAGWNKMMGFISSLFEEKEKENVRKGLSALDTLPFLYIQQGHSSILFASLLAFEYSDDIDKFFKEKIGVNNKSFVITVIVKKRVWKNNSKPEEFWGAEGLLKQFLEILKASSLFTKNLYVEKRELFNFTLNQDTWYQLRDYYGEEKKLFYLLNMLLASDMLAHVTVSLNKTDGSPLSNGNLSEGEQQLVTIKAINELLIEENTLLLFDEPDTYLHPSLQDDLIRNIQKFAVENTEKRSHFLITSHNPSLLNNLNPTKGELYIMSEGKLLPHDLRWFGRDVNEVVHQIMDSEYRPAWALSDIAEIDILIENGKIDDAKSRLTLLTQKLSESDSEIVRLQAKLDFFMD